MKNQEVTTALDIDHAPRWLLYAEVAQIARVSTRTVRQWITLGYIRAAKPAGGRVLIDRDSLRAFIEGSTA
ncbi:MAG: helix-turn-helix domain-containing protein [Myxococcales bacterium]|nr:helix-turn-helix domain-containing protein [Myxococcales bacterium]